MKRILSLNGRTTFRTKGLPNSFYRRRISRRVAHGLILPAVLIVLSGGLLHGEDSSESLYIDPNGNVGIGTNKPAAKLDVNGIVEAQKLEINGDINSAGTVDAQKFKGDGTSMTIKDYGNLKEALDKKLDKRGGAITGSLKIDEKLSAVDFNICYSIQCRQDTTEGPVKSAKFGKWTEYSIPPKGNHRYEGGCRIRLYICK